MVMAGKKELRPWLLGGTLLGALVLPGLYNGLMVRRYRLPTGRFACPIRIALVSDLHACKHGEEERQLIETIHREKPELLLMAGDIFDHRQDIRNVECFLRGVAGRYPCYYVTGNHEYWHKGKALPGDMALLARYGVRRLSGEMVTVTVKGQALNLCGVDDPDASAVHPACNGGNSRSFLQQLAHVGTQPRDGNYTILLSHRPEPFRFYACYGFDLALCGHAHGGQWRIPGLLNGLYAPHQGLFPKYAGGKYQKGGTTMIVSRGLARENTRVPRFYDPPELVIVDLA